MTKRGRPPVHDDAIRDAILSRLAQGESLRSICRDKKAGMPDASTVHGWVLEEEDFAKRYTRARELQADMLVDEILEIADDNSRDIIEVENDDGTTYERVNHDHINRSRLRVDTRKWFASKVFPKRYGDKQEIEHTGKDGTPLIPVINFGKKPTDK